MAWAFGTSRQQSPKRTVARRVEPEALMGSNSDRLAELDSVVPVVDTPVLDSQADQPGLAEPDARVEAENDSRLRAESLADLAEQASRGEPGAEEAYRQALQGDAAALAGHFAALTPEEQRSYLTEGQGGVLSQQVIRAALDSGDTELIRSVMGSLMEGAESLGRENIDALGAQFAGHEQMLAGEMPGLIAEGHGALLAVSVLGVSDPSLQGALFSVSDNFSRTSEAALKARAQFALASQRMRMAGATDEEVAAAEERFRTQNPEVFGSFEESARIYASTLEGLGMAADTRGVGQGLYEDHLADAGKLAFTEVGAEASATALLREGEGRRTWLDSAPEAEEGQQAKERAALISQGAMQGLGAMVAAGDTEGASLLLRGLKERSNPEMGMAIERIEARIAEGSVAGEPLFGDELFGDLALSADERQLLERMRLGASIGGTLQGKAKIAAGPTALAGELSGVGAYKRMGAAMSLFSNGIDALTAEEWEDQVLAGMKSTSDIGGLLALEKASGGAGKLGKLLASRGLGAAFAMLDVAMADNAAQASLAMLPLLGAELGSMVAPGPGTLIGGVVGGGMAVLLELAGVGKEDPVAPIAQEAIRSMMLDRGLSPDMAEVFAEELSNGDSVDVARRLRFLAQDMGYPDELALIDRLGQLDPSFVRDVIFGANETLQLLDGPEGTTRAPLPMALANSDPYQSFVDEVSQELAPLGSGG